MDAEEFSSFEALCSLVCQVFGQKTSALGKEMKSALSSWKMDRWSSLKHVRWSVMQLDLSELYYLRYFEECIGPFSMLTQENGLLVARVGKVSLALPCELEPSLRPHLGQRVAILKTDVPGKNFLFRVLG